MTLLRYQWVRSDQIEARASGPDAEGYYRAVVTLADAGDGGRHTLSAVATSRNPDHAIGHALREIADALLAGER